MTTSAWTPTTDGVTLTDHEAALLYVAAGHSPNLPFALVARLQDAYGRNANAAPAAPVGRTPAVAWNDETNPTTLQTFTAGNINIIGWHRKSDCTARFTVWNDETILPNVDWTAAWNFIANRGDRSPVVIERMLRGALALNEAR